MRGLAFTIEAAFTILAIIVISSYFIFTPTPPSNLIVHKTISLDIANLVSNENYYSLSLLEQQEKIELWSLKTGLCIKITKDSQSIQSSNCKEPSQVMTSQRIYFDSNTGSMSAFTVEISPPG